MITVKRIKKLDENVINKIAAGEIIQRPANAVKELLENSLDAGSTQIIISIKQGGLGVIQIQDNGSGICKEDFPLLCEKFTTSKLQDFHDLLTIATFGFRGEALASITHVAHVQITSKTNDSPCAFRGDFSDSKLIDSVKPCAGNTGTIVKIEDLFYNVTIRKQTMKSPREEYAKICEVVTNYSILNADNCSITLKRIDDNANQSPDVRILGGTSMDDCIVELFGRELSKQLIAVDHKDEKLAYSISGRISKSSYNSHKLKFILFINKRLVHCDLLKKSIESLYGNLLPKHTFPFVFFHLELPPKNLDVNVHPTKFEVHFLHQEVIVSSITDCLEKLIFSSSESRGFSTKSLLNKSMTSNRSANSSFYQSSPKCSEKIRVDPKEQKINSFFSLNDSGVSESNLSLTEKTPVASSSVKKEDISFNFSTNKEVGTVISSKKSTMPLISDYQKDNKENINGKESEPILKCIGNIEPLVEQKQYRKFDLSTLAKLRKSIETEDICNWKNFVYVGQIDRNRVLIQRDKDLFLLNTSIVNYNLFYQLCLYHFGNFGVIDLVDPDSNDDYDRSPSNRTSLKDLFIFGLRETGDLYQGIDPDEVINRLKIHADMLMDYFSIQIDTYTMSLVTIPLVLDKFIPDLRRLPKFIVNLCTKIDWVNEEMCLHGICREIAEFYAYGIGSSTSLVADKIQYEQVFESTIFPMFKSFLRLPVSFENDGTLVKLTSLPDLYNVFERC